MSPFRLVQAARWPRPFALLLIAAAAALLAAAWRPLLLVAAGIWGVAAGLAVLDARARGRHGVTSGVAVVLLGPLAWAAIARVTRRHVRKAGPRLASAMPPALVALVAGAGIGYLAGAATLDRVAFTARAPSDALGRRIRAGDRLVISPALVGRVSRGELVALDRFAAAARVLGPGPVAAVGRVLGMPGEWVGATETGELYVCAEPPDITKPLDDGVACFLPDETSYVTSQTAAFGPVEVPDDAYFVLADDRESLADSRTFGPVPRDALAGRIVATAWPPGRIAVR